MMKADQTELTTINAFVLLEQDYVAFSRIAGVLLRGGARLATKVI